MAEEKPKVASEEEAVVTVVAQSNGRRHRTVITLQFSEDGHCISRPEDIVSELEEHHSEISWYDYYTVIQGEQLPDGHTNLGLRYPSKALRGTAERNDPEIKIYTRMKLE